MRLTGIYKERGKISLNRYLAALFWGASFSWLCGQGQASMPITSFWGLPQLNQLEIGFPLTQLKLLRELCRRISLYLHILGLVRLFDAGIQGISLGDNKKDG